MSAEHTTELLAAARAGSPDAVDALYARCASKLLPLVRLRLGSALRAHLESDDILQAALAKSLAHIRRAPGAGAEGGLEAVEGRSLMAWLARIAENEIRDQWDHIGRARRDRRRTVAFEPPVHDRPGADRSALSALIASEGLARLERALASLSDAHREIILLRKFEELGFREIGEKLGKSDDACRMLFARAMAALTLALGATNEE